MGRDGQKEKKKLPGEHLMPRAKLRFRPRLLTKPPCVPVAKDEMARVGRGLGIKVNKLITGEPLHYFQKLLLTYQQFVVIFSLEDWIPPYYCFGNSR